MIKIQCLCCYGVAKVSDKYEFQALPKCRNGTYVEMSAKAVPRISGRRLDLIRIWDEQKKAYVPLIEKK